MIKEYGWTTSDGKNFANDISQFNGESMITLPDNSKLSITWFTPRHSEENELIYWETVYRGIHYTIFND